MRAFFAVLLLTLPSASALRTFTTNCTTPNITSDFYYVSSPNVRGSLQIIWTSISTLIICSYSVLHLNVPEQRRGKNPGLWGDMKWTCSHTLSSLGWSVVVVLAPEFILTKSMDEFFVARKAMKKLKHKLPLAARSWTLTHMFFANMGGFVLETTTTASDATAETGTTTGTTTEAMIAAPVENEPEKTELLPLGAMDIVAVVTSDFGDLADIFPIEAPITEGELQDRSKSDAFTKMLAMFQITYFFVDFFSRIAQKLPITQLELTVVGIAVYSLLAYGFLFKKPKAVNTTFTIKKFSAPDCGNLAKLSAVLAREPTSSPEFPSRTWRATAPSFWDLEMKWAGDAIFLLVAPLGVIHLSGWNLSFPTWIDAWLWRASAIVVTAIGPAIFLYFLAEDLIPQRFTITTSPVWYILAALYTVGRLILLVETVRCLFFLPPRAFSMTSWTGGLPHFG